MVSFNRDMKTFQCRCMMSYRRIVFQQLLKIYILFNVCFSSDLGTQDVIVIVLGVSVVVVTAIALIFYR